jgi:uncharacterized membrane protein YiaA
MGGHMLAWIELILGVVAAFVGVTLMCSAANGDHDVPTVEDDRRAIAGLIVAIVGIFSFLLGLVQLAVKLADWAFS